MKAAAFRSAISTKIANGELVVVDAIALEAPKTKLVANILKNFNYDQKTLLVVSNQSDVARAGANIAKLTVTEATLANVYQLVSNVAVIVTVDAIKQIEEAYSL